MGSAATVSDDGWRLFRERSERASAVLVGSKATSAAWPQWYIQMIGVRAHASDAAGAKEAFREGIKRFPEELAMFSEMAYYSEPRWGGSWGAVDEVVQLSTKSVRRESSDATYARMYMETGGLSRSPSRLFTETMADWARMRAGLLELVDANRESDVLRAQLLAYACIAKDAAAYIAHRARTEALLPEGLWTLQSRATCDFTFG